MNDQLAKSIEGELFNNHINSQFLERFSNGEKKRILRSIHVRSLKAVLEDWAPDFASKNSNWLIENNDVRQMFENLRNARGVEVNLEDYRELESEYLNQMFDKRKGRFLSLNEYLDKHSDMKDSVRKAWYKQVEKRRNNGQRSLIEACTILRNQLLLIVRPQSCAK